MKTDNVNLGKSFDKLKSSLLESVRKTEGNGVQRYAYAFGYLETAVKKHLIDCTDISMKDIQDELALNQDDLKGVIPMDEVTQEIENELLKNKL